MLTGISAPSASPHLRSQTPVQVVDGSVPLPPVYGPKDLLCLILFGGNRLSLSGWVWRRVTMEGVQVWTKTANGAEGSAVQAPGSGMAMALAVGHPSGWDSNTANVPASGALLVQVHPSSQTVTTSVIGGPVTSEDASLLTFLL